MVFLYSDNSQGHSNGLDKKNLEIFNELQDEHFRNLVGEFNQFFRISPNYKAMEELKLKDFPIEVTRIWQGSNIFKNKTFNKTPYPAGAYVNLERELIKQQMIEVWDEEGMRDVRISKIIGMKFNIEAKDLQHKMAKAYISYQDNRYIDALRLFNEVNIQSSKLDKYTRSVVLNNIGCLKFYLNNEKGVIGNFTEALLLNKDKQIYYNLACAYTWSKKWDKAKENFKRAEIFNSKSILEFLEIKPVEVKVEPIEPIVDLVEKSILRPEKPTLEKREIANVFVGIPKNISAEIIWVQDKFRTNLLSLIPGGTTVVVEYHNGEVLGYDKIKRPSDYIGKFFEDSSRITSYEYCKMDELAKVNFYKERIFRIFARKNKNGHVFEEVWNCESSHQLPWKSLAKFDLSVKMLFR